MKTVDASGLTAMPGMIDMHVHWHMRGRQLGARQGRLWLSYGITTVRGVADPAYRMLETRESQAAGLSVGPRYLASGEALDGHRLLYDAMRPVLDADHLERELDRAHALGYDLLKTYIDLPWTSGARVVERSRGLPVTSHYLYPAARYGQVGLEHLGGGNRLGYTQVADRNGRAYQDVIEVLAATGMALCPTLIFAAVRYATDRGLLTDERTRTLLPASELRLLDNLVAAATGPLAPRYRLFLDNATDAALRVHRRGGLVVSGSDAPLDTTALALHQNLRALVDGGFTPLEALRTVTTAPAGALGLADELGTIERGRRADLVLVAGNPLTDIAAAAAVHTTVIGGTPHTRAELLAPFQKSAQAQREPTTRPSTVVDRPEHWWHAAELGPHTCQHG